MTRSQLIKIGLLATLVLGTVPPATSEQVPKLLTGVPGYRFAELWTEGAEYALEQLYAMARSVDSEHRQYAVLRMGEIEDPPQDVIDSLMVSLGDDAERVRLQAVASLKRIGAAAQPALLSAATRTGTNEAHVLRREMAFVTLMNGSSPSLLFPLDVDSVLRHDLSLLESEQLPVLAHRESVLGLLPRGSEVVSDAMVEALERGDCALRRAALGLVDGAWVSNRHLDRLVQMMIDDASARPWAARALVTVEDSPPHPSEALMSSGKERLEELRDHPNPAIAAASVLALKEHFHLAGGRVTSDWPRIDSESWVEAAVAMCFRKDFCGAVELNLIEANPQWRREVLAAVVGRFESKEDLDERAFETIGALAPEAPNAIAWRSELLRHSDPRLRALSALSLTSALTDWLGFWYPDVPVPLAPPLEAWEVLEQTARSPSESDLALAAIDRILDAEAVASWFSPESPESAQQHLGWAPDPSPIQSILADDSTATATRLRLLEYGALRVWESSGAAVPTLLQVAKSTRVPAIREKCFEALRWDGRDHRRELWLVALLSSEADDRRLALDYVSGWSGWSEDLGDVTDELRTVFAQDPVLDLRAAALVELDQVEPDSVRLREALSSPHDELHDAAIDVLRRDDERFSLLLNHVRQGGRLTFRLLETLADRDLLAMLEALSERVAGASDPPAIQEAIESLLDAETDAELLIGLSSPDEGRQRLALRQLMVPDPWALDGLLAGMALDRKIRETVRRHLDRALERLHPPQRRYEPPSGSEKASNSRGELGDPLLPPFPWPPPAGYTPHPIPLDWALGGDSRSPHLGAVCRGLADAIEAADPGFVWRLFSLPDGFAVMARMERVREDGTPVDGTARWKIDGAFHEDFWTFLLDMFHEKPGHFRTIVFAVTEDLSPGADDEAELPEMSTGGLACPWQFDEMELEERKIVALVYGFERGKNAKMSTWTDADGAPSARQHLSKAGFGQF